MRAREDISFLALGISDLSQGLDTIEAEGAAFEIATAINAFNRVHLDRK